MTSLFRELEADDLTEEEKSIFDVFKASLSYPAPNNLLAERLSNDIVFFCKSAVVEGDPGTTLMMVWGMMFDMIRHIPPDHVWQDVWISALKTLQTQQNLPPDDREMPNGLSWQELPWLLDNLSLIVENTRARDQIMWKNVSSFAARLYGSDLTNTDIYPISDFRYTVETYKSDESVPEIPLWVTTEWAIRCSDKLWEFLKQAEEPQGALANWYEFGPAFVDVKGVGLLSIERWGLWKKWFSERKEHLAKDNSSTANSAMLARVSAALKKMERAESQS
ncbi:hypothetical protein GGR57DRAFT_292120 [Xylariaceae sp. FL1272]|nr:hypothetical protein GGR57DRAFT_292120 [Xylariaceae sp. FL1272]